MNTKGTTINLRDVPSDKARRFKSQAALEGITLKEFLIRGGEELLRQACSPQTAKNPQLREKAQCMERKSQDILARLEGNRSE